MKRQRTHIVIASIAIALLTTSCDENVSDVWSKYKISAVPHYLSVSERSCYFGEATGGTKYININASNTSWEITDLPDWISVDKTSGTGSTSIYVKCGANPSLTDNRTALFTIRSTDTDWEYSVSVSATQVRSKKYATAEMTSVTLDGKESSQAVSVTSNVTDWSVSVSAASAGESSTWLTATKGEGTIALQASPNPNNVARRAYVILKTDDEEQQITVTQRAGNISSTLDKLTYTYEAGSQTVTITSDAPWKAQTASSWIEVQPSSAGAGSTEVSVRTLSNSSFDTRSGYVYFVMADDNKVELPVEQGAITFSLSETEMAFPHSATSKTLIIDTNAEWEFSSYLPDWLIISAKEGKGTSEVTISVKEYQIQSVSPRCATISFKPKLISKNFEVAILQTGQELHLGTNTLQFTNKSNSQSITIDATGKWSASTSATWITVSPSTGENGKATCLISVEENTGEERTGEVQFNFFEETYKIVVTQQGAFLTLSTDGMQFGSTGGNLRVDILSNTHWEVSIKDDAAWLNVSPKAGEDNNSLIISVNDNPSAKSRNGEVIVMPKDCQPLLVSVTQAARYLNISTSSIEFTAVEGTSELITIDSDGDIDVTTESDWITINKVNEKSFTLKAQANESYGSRTGHVVVFIDNLLSGEIKRTIAVRQNGKDNNGHACVDLGLPSGLLWATCNVGAIAPEDFGDYFAWGETTVKSNYSLSTYTWCNGNYESLTKYNTSGSYGMVDNKTVLDLSDDAANANWGGNWRMPTRDEWKELQENCTWTWKTQNGVNGRKVTSKSNGISIFLPAAGYRYGASLYNAGSNGLYWLPSLHESQPSLAWRLHFGSGSMTYEGCNNRHYGLSVRPVFKP